MRVLVTKNSLHWLCLLALGQLLSLSGSAHAYAREPGRARSAVSARQHEPLRWRFDATQRDHKFTTHAQYTVASDLGAPLVLAAALEPELPTTDPHTQVVAASACDFDTACSSVLFRDVNLLVKRMQQTVADLRETQRIGELELFAGPALPNTAVASPNPLARSRYALDYLPPIDNNPGILNAGVTVF